MIMDAEEKKNLQKKIFTIDKISEISSSVFFIREALNPERLTINITYYNEWDVLVKHLSFFSKLKFDNLFINILDDGSAVSLVDKVFEIKSFGIKNISVYRIVEDIPWNIPGVRNLATFVTFTPWLIFLDIDQHLDENSISKLLKLSSVANNGEFFTFKRTNGRFTAGTMMISMLDLLSIHGHDESLVGNYGYNDQLLRGHLFKSNSIEYRLTDVACSEYKTPLVGNRDTSINEEKYYTTLSMPLKPIASLNFKWMKLL